MGITRLNSPIRFAQLLGCALVVFACRRSEPAQEELSSTEEVGVQVGLELGVRQDGSVTPTWRIALADTFPIERAEILAKELRPLTPDDLAWWQVVERVAPALSERFVHLARPFGIEPFDVLVAGGNRTDRDGFAWMPSTLAIDLEAFARAYGPPDGGSDERMTRILSHEYVHLLTYHFYGLQKAPPGTPLERALWTMFFEGYGDYHSISARWMPDADGEPSAAARELLGRLEPVLVERLEALSTAGPEQEAELRRNLASGRFTDKWGSLPVALWLRGETHGGDELQILSAFLRAGPDGVLPIVHRNIAADLRPRIDVLMR